METNPLKQYVDKIGTSGLSTRVELIDLFADIVKNVEPNIDLYKSISNTVVFSNAVYDALELQIKMTNRDSNTLEGCVMLAEFVASLRYEPVMNERVYQNARTTLEAALSLFMEGGWYWIPTWQSYFEKRLPTEAKKPAQVVETGTRSGGVVIENVSSSDINILVRNVENSRVNVVLDNVSGSEVRVAETGGGENRHLYLSQKNVIEDRTRRQRGQVFDENDAKDWRNIVNAVAILFILFIVGFFVYVVGVRAGLITPEKRVVTETAKRKPCYCKLFE